MFCLGDRRGLLRPSDAAENNGTFLHRMRTSDLFLRQVETALCFVLLAQLHLEISHTLRRGSILLRVLSHHRKFDCQSIPSDLFLREAE